MCFTLRKSRPAQRLLPLALAMLLCLPLAAQAKAPITAWIAPPPGMSSLPLRERAADDAPMVAEVNPSQTVQMLGAAENGWVQVSFRDARGMHRGYLPESQLIPAPAEKLQYAPSFVIDAGGAETSLALHVAPDAHSRQLGEYYSGTWVNVEGYTDRWACVSVQLYGAPHAVRGYMRRSALAETALPDTPYDYFAETVATDGSGYVTLRKYPQDEAEEMGSLPGGSLIVLVAEDGEWRVVRNDCISGYLHADQVKPLHHSTLRENPYFIFRRGYAQGYATVTPPEGAFDAPLGLYCQDEHATASLPAGETVLLVRDLGEWSQVLLANSNGYFIRSKYLQPLRIPALSGESIKVAHGAGVYTAGTDLPPDIYAFSAPEGASGALEITRQDGFIRRIEAANGDFYNFYLPEGASLSITGGGMLTGMNTTFLWWQPDGTGSTAFTGNGRFLPYVNFDGQLHVELAPGAEEGYFIVSSLADEIVGEPKRVPVRPGDRITIDAGHGDFVEIHNCTISTNG